MPFPNGGFLGLRLYEGAFRHFESRCAEAVCGDLTNSHGHYTKIAAIPLAAQAASFLAAKPFGGFL